MCLLCAAPAARRDPVPFPTAPASLDWGLGGSLRWTGVAGLRLDLGGAAIAFDPFVTRPGLLSTLLRAPRPDARRVEEHFAGLDAVFVGHTHYDHAMDLGAVAAASPAARFHGSRTTTELLRRLGIEEARLETVTDGAHHEAGPFGIEAVGIEHGIVPWIRHVDRIDLAPRGLPRTPFRYPRGDVFAWRVSFAGRVVYIQGSAGLVDGPLARQGPVDLLLACLAARHGTRDYLARLGRQLRPDLLAPIHHDDFFRSLDRPPRPVAGLDWPGFLADAGALEAAHGTRLVLLPFDRDVAL